ncbi:transmembrane protein 132E-like [Ptychodera flava]|uniref:transmembrane protein 132E-like n=1 Tax=Ptychodera flava TaxID=63121 RepID=UPI00396A6752
MPVVFRPSGRPNAAVALGSCIIGWFPLLLIFSQFDVTTSSKLNSKEEWSSLSQLQAEFSVPDPRGVFFLKNRAFDSQSGRQNSTETFSEVLIGIVNPANHVVQASYGPFSVEQDTLKQNTSKKYYSHVDIATYMVKSTVRASSSVVKVLFHITHGLETHNNGATSTNLNKEVPCLKLYLLYNEHEQTAACKPHGRKLICLLEVEIPNSWWIEMETGGHDQIKVYYTIEDYEENSSCQQSSGNSIRLGKLSDNGKEPQLYRVGDVTMMRSDPEFKLVKDNPHIWLEVPQEDLFPGTKFVISALLLPNSTLSSFSIKAKAKKGIRFSSISPHDGHGWDFDFTFNDKQSSVLMFHGVYTESDSRPTESVNICDFEFEVENMTSASAGSPHVSWRIDDRLNEESVPTRISTVFSRNTGMIEALVPLRKEKNLVNTALLNGEKVSSPLSIIRIGYSNEMEDVTNTAKCVSMNPTVLQAAADCSNVYLDGTENDGALSVNIKVTYNGITEDVTYTVWVPELPLTVTLTDEKLSLIKSWKVPEMDLMNRFPRNTDFSNPTSLLKEDTGRDHERNYRCHLRYQDSEVDVYTRFYAPHEDTDSRAYLFNESLMQRVTSLLSDQLKISDKTIAVLNGRKVIGHSPGIAQVEVLAPSSNDILGSQQFSVAGDKVSVIDLQVNLVTGLALTTKKYGSLDDVIETKAVAQRALFAESQKGFIDITVFFDDGKTMSLMNANVMEYSVDMTSLNNIVAPSPTDHPPGLIALAEGTTGVVLKLKLPEFCQKPNKPSSNELKETVLYVSVEFTIDGRRKIMNKTRNEFDPGILHTEPNTGLFSEEESKESEEEGPKNPSREDNHGIIPIDKLTIPNAEYDPNENDDYELAHPSTLPSRRRGLSELEIGMYALLGIFCLAIIVFLINCILFAARYKSKRIPNDGRTVGNTHDWVWLGKPADCSQMNGSLHETIPLEMACSANHGEDAQAEGKGSDEGEGEGSEQGSEGHDGGNSVSGDQGNEDTPSSGRRNHDLESGYHSKSGSQEIRITINPGHCEEEEDDDNDGDEDSVTETVIANIINTDPAAMEAGDSPKSSVHFSSHEKVNADELLPHSEHLRETQA